MRKKVATRKEIREIQAIAREEYQKALRERNDTESRYWLGYKNALEVVYDPEIRKLILSEEPNHE